MSECYLRYEKTENARYVSHLDFVRMFGRALRRADVPVAYSAGFNPHPLLGFALPLSVGCTSSCELLEITLEREMPAKDIMHALNRVLPEGVRILSAHEGKSNMKKADNALYIITPEHMPPCLDEFMKRETVVTEKKTKSGIKPTDIRPDIKSLVPKGNTIEAILSAGSRANLKPDVVIKAMNEYIPEYNSGEFDCHRAAIYDADMNLI